MLSLQIKLHKKETFLFITLNKLSISRGTQFTSIDFGRPYDLSKDLRHYEEHTVSLSSEF